MSSELWTQLGIKEELCSLLAEQGIVEPTAVQAQSIKALLSGDDISVQSQTGSGKTLAFLLPILQNINIQSKAIQAVVLAPTQELAMQIVRVAQSYGQPLGVKVQQLIGGAAVKRQIEKLKDNPHLVVGTPGRMNELVKSKKLKLHQVKFLIIDEADQTFELGSSADMDQLMFNINKMRQTAFFSATYPEVMARYEGRWMKQPQHIMIKPEQKVAQGIEHYYIVCDQRSKLDTTRKILRSIEEPSALIFVNETNQISNWESKLKYEGFKIEALYGEANKQARSSTLNAFREGKLEAILSTDVAARGIDIVDLPLVIQLEPAIDADHYVHRAGRTGRMGKQGLVISIITPQEKFIIDKFMRQLGIVIEERMLFRGQLLNEAQISEATKFKTAVKPGVKPSTKTNEKIHSEKKAKNNDVASSKSKAVSKGVDGSRPKEIVSSYRENREEKSVKRDKKQEIPVKNKAKKKPTEGKNKGAPKWLKAKRENSDQ